MPETEDGERAVDDLFTAPPEGFAQARDALSKRLKDQGDAGSARRVGALRKPVRSAWAVNRLAHEDRSAVEELLQVGEQLRLAQRRALSGGVASLKVVPGASEREQPSPPAEDRAERASREREIRAAERRERQMRERAERIRAEVTAMEERLAERKEKLGAAEAEARGAAVELKRLRG